MVSDDIVIIPEGLDDVWCEFCMAYKYQESRKFVKGHHYENKQLVLHLQIGHLCLDCGTFNLISDAPEEPF